MLGSTQTEAKRLAEAGAQEGTLIIAERQRKGKGRLGRHWASPPGGLWCSLILRPQMTPSVAPQLSLVASLAVAEAITAVTRLQPAIKWPNDLVLQGKKVAGILTDMGTQGGELQWVVVGIGINVNNDIPRSLIGQAISLREVIGEPIACDALLRVVLDQMEARYRSFLQDGFQGCRQEYRERCLVLHRLVRVEQFQRGRNRARWKAGETYQGIVTDIDDDGALLLQSADHSVHRILAGDVTLQ